MAHEFIRIIYHHLGIWMDDSCFIDEVSKGYSRSAGYIWEEKEIDREALQIIQNDQISSGTRKIIL